MKTKVALAVAIILGVVAMVGVRELIVRKREEVESSRKTILVVVAGQNIPSGTEVLPAHVNTARREARSVHQRAIVGSRFEMYRGRRVWRNIREGEMLLDTDFFRPPQERKFDSDILTGERAITIAVDQISGVSGLILPGSRVDVLATFADSSSGGSGQTQTNFITRTLLSYVRVLAIDQQTTQGSVYGAEGRQGSYSAVTLAASPLEAQIIALASSQSQGMLRLTLRNPTDTESTVQTVKPVDVRSLDEAVQAADQHRRSRIPKPAPEDDPGTDAIIPAPTNP